MCISFIVAMDRRCVIGRAGDLPWRLPDDLRYFKHKTLGKPVIMGRKTYASIGRPLPGRHNIVVTRDPNYAAPGCTVVHSVEDALKVAGGAEEVMIAGGAEIFTQLLPRASRIYLTLVETEVADGDTFFPELEPDVWEEVRRETHTADERHPHPFHWITLERRPALD